MVTYRSSTSKFKHLTDHHGGGEVQVMFGYVEKYEVYDCGSLCLNNKKYMKHQTQWMLPPKDSTEISHFLDPDYFKTSFILEDILYKMGVVDETEKGKTSEFLKETRKKQADLKRLKKEKNHET